MGDNTAIRVEGLWKRYGLPVPGLLRQARRCLRTWRNGRKGSSEASELADGGPWALRDINLEVRRGETLGIIGPNGAGKSTLLKVLAGVTPPTRGSVEVHGRIFPMIELNAGMHHELTGRENVRLLGAIMGIPRGEFAAKMPEIEEFSELGEWFDRPVRMYSSGMLARLGFSVATQIQSDIILVDETFSVGDLKFQNKSLARMQALRESGATVLVVTHSLDMLQFISQRGVLLENGRLLATGSSLQVVTQYEGLVFQHEREHFAAHPTRRDSSDDVTVFGARIFGSGGESLNDVLSGMPFGIEIDFEIRRTLRHPLFSVSVVAASGVDVMWNVSEEDSFLPGEISGTHRVRVWHTENRLANGSYTVNFTIRDRISYETIERIRPVAAFAVVGPRRSRGVVVASCQWSLTSPASTNTTAILR